MSFEVYVINFFIAIGVFFSLRWLFKKFVKSNDLRLGLTLAGTVILTPLIYVALILAFFSALFYEPSRDFDKARWFDEKLARYEMRDDIIESQLLKGKSKKEVIDLIGDPNHGSDSTDVWNYDLGTSGAGFGWQFNYLLVTFKNDRVVKVEKQEILD